jgi:hypothetical protein
VSEEWKHVLRTAWAELSKHASYTRQFRTKRLSATDIQSAYAGTRSVDSAPCLLIEGSVNPAMLFEVGGMRLGAYKGELGALLALTREDREQEDLFLAVCSDVVASASGGPPDGYLARFLGRLDAWRSFLRERRPSLSKNETVGLIGELLILERLLKLSGDLLLSWSAPDDGLHDFNSKGKAIEVKTAIGPATRLRVSTLDQLDPAGLDRLTLINIRLIERVDGRCLCTIIDDLNAFLPDESSRRLFSNALLKRGLMPDDRPATEHPVVEMHEIIAYRVDDNFPKLIRARVPTAIVDAEYSLELRGVTAFIINLEEALIGFSRSVP